MLLMGDVDVNEADPEGNVVPCNHSSLQNNHVMKDSCKELLDDDFDDYDNADFNESYTGLKTSAGHQDFRSSNCSAHGAKSKSQSAPKQGSKFPRRNHWRKHDYTRKIFVGGFPPSVDSEHLREFFSTEFGPVEEAVVIGLKIGNRMQPRGFGFVKFQREEDMINAKEAHHVYVLGKRVEINDAVPRASLPVELQRATSLRQHVQECPKETHSVLDGELTEGHNLQKQRPLPEKCLPSWFFVFRKRLTGFLVVATERLGERYPLSSLKGDFRATCRMELDHGALGYPKLSDFMRSLLGICRMCVLPVGNGPATHMVLLLAFSRPKYVPLLEPYSFQHDELPELVSDHQSPRSTTKITEDSPHNTDSQQGDACSEINVQSQQGDECSRSNAEHHTDGDSTDNGTLLNEITASTRKAALIESLPTKKPDLVEFVPLPQKIESGPMRKPDLVEFGPTSKLGAACDSYVQNHQGEECSRRRREVQIFISQGAGRPRTLSLQVNLDEPSKFMMQSYKERTKINSVGQYFIHGKKILNPDRTLMSYGVERNSTIYASVRIRGGYFIESNYTIYASAGLRGERLTVDVYVKQAKDTFMTEVELPDRNISLEMTLEGCQFLRSLICCFTDTFFKRRSWDGNFTFKDFEMSNGLVKIVKNATESLTSSSMKNDIDVLIKFIEPVFYRNKDNLILKYPPYFDNLIDFLKGMKSSILLRTQKLFLETHICFMRSDDRLNLCILLKKKYDGMNEGGKAKWDRILENTTCPSDWNSRLPKVAVFADIFKKAHNDGFPYKASTYHAFRLMRNFCMHALEYRIDTRTQIEKFKDNSGVELMVPAHMKSFLASFVEKLMEANENIERELSSTTAHCPRCALQTSQPGMGAEQSKPESSTPVAYNIIAEAQKGRPSSVSCFPEGTGAKQSKPGPSTPKAWNVVVREQEGGAGAQKGEPSIAVPRNSGAEQLMAKSSKAAIRNKKRKEKKKARKEAEKKKTQESGQQ